MTEKVQLGNWIFLSQHKFVIVGLQKVFPVYVCVEEALSGCEKLERMKNKSTTEGEERFRKRGRQLKQGVSLSRWEEELKALTETFLSAT